MLTNWGRELSARAFVTKPSDPSVIPYSIVTWYCLRVRSMNINLVVSRYSQKKAISNDFFGALLVPIQSISCEHNYLPFSSFLLFPSYNWPHFNGDDRSRTSKKINIHSRILEWPEWSILMPPLWHGVQYTTLLSPGPSPRYTTMFRIGILFTLNDFSKNKSFTVF